MSKIILTGKKLKRGVMENLKKGAGRPIKMPYPWGDLAKLVGGTFILCEKLGITQATLNRWAHRKSRIPLTASKELIRLCEQFNVDVKDGSDFFK